MRQYKIWNRVHTIGGKKSSCDYGANECDSREILVGTSSRNSHHFASVSTDVIERDGALVFRLFVDGEIVKQSRVENGALYPEPVA